MSRNTVLRFQESLDEFYAAHPLDFFFFDEEGQQVLYILNDDAPGKTHYLTIGNKSDNDITIRSEGLNIPSRPSSDNFHFELRFRPGTLPAAQQDFISIGNGDWRVSAKAWKSGEAPDIEAGTVSLYLLYKVDEELVLPSRRSLMLPLHSLKASALGGSRGSRIALRYFLDDTDTLVTTPDPAQAEYYRQERIDIINQRGIKEIPIHAGFVGNSTVFNDGETANTLRLQISNLLRNDYIPLCERSTDSPTRFVLSFDTSEQAEAWALADPDNVAAIDLRVLMPAGKEVFWHIEKETQGQTPQWILTVEEAVQIEVGEHFSIELSGIITSMPSGFTTLHLQYENIPGYWDGHFVVPVEKSPIRLKDQLDGKGNVIQTFTGVGVAEPEAPLHVKGELKADSMVLADGVSSLDFTGSLKGKSKLAAEASKTTKVEILAQNGDINFRGKIGSQQKAASSTHPKLELDAANGDVYFDGQITSRQQVGSGAAARPKLQLDATTGDVDFDGQITSRQKVGSGGTAKPKLQLDATTGNIQFDGKLTSRQTDGSGANKASRVSIDAATGEVEVKKSVKIGPFTLEETKNIDNKNRLEIKDSTGALGGYIPKGGIIMWSGTTPPAGWALCIGTHTVNGNSVDPPDLRGRFIVGYDSRGNTTPADSTAKDQLNYKTIGNTGGANSIGLTANNLPAHDHRKEFPSGETRDHGDGVIEHIEKRIYNRILTNNTLSSDKNILPDGGHGDSRGWNEEKKEVARKRPSLFWSSTLASVGNNESHENRPPYYVLAFIMKL